MNATVNRNGALGGRVAVVTGASRGIGAAIARRLAMEGAKVIVTARTVEAADHPLPGTITETVDAIRTAGGEAAAVQCDLAQPVDRRRLVEAAHEIYGPVSILVNNAAVTYYAKIRDFTDKRWRLMFEVQVFAAMELSQQLLPDMIEGGIGHIINLSSGAAFHPEQPYPEGGGRGGTVYGMCKAALERFSTGLASELHEDNVAVNAISPGLVATPGTLHHGLITEASKDRQSPVEAIAESCLFIASTDPQEITGRVDQIQPFMQEFRLTPGALIA